MARKKTGFVEDLMEITARMPWKVGVGLAIVAYLILHYFATKTPLTTNPAELKAVGKTMGDSMVSVMWTTAASFLQYVVPLAFLIGAGVSAMRRKRDEQSVDSDLPVCPKCGKDMVRRVAKSGANAGNSFWGCSQYPACRGVRN